MSPNALSNLVASQLGVLGITQTEFAERVSAQQATVSRWLSGKVIPSDKAVPLIAAALQVDERQVWAARSQAQEERLKRSEQTARTARRDLDDALDRVSEFVKTYEAFHAAYRQMGDQVDTLVSQLEKLTDDIADLKRDVRSLRRKEPR